MPAADDSQIEFIGIYQEFVTAAEGKDREGVKRIIQKYPALHAFEGPDGSLVQILDEAAPEFLEPAFASGLSPDAGQSEVTQTFLQKAAADGDLKKLTLAIRYGADLELRNDEGETSLGYAVSWGQLDAVQQLVEAGADINAIETYPDGRQATALDCSHEHAEVRHYLLQHGAKSIAALPS